MKKNVIKDIFAGAFFSSLFIAMIFLIISLPEKMEKEQYLINLKLDDRVYFYILAQSLGMEELKKIGIKGMNTSYEDYLISNSIFYYKINTGNKEYYSFTEPKFSDNFVYFFDTEKKVWIKRSDVIEIEILTREETNAN